MKHQCTQKTKLRNTKNRQLILEFLKQQKSPITADEIYFSLKNNSHISLSTIYRILSLLCEHNLVLKNSSNNGKSYYQLNSMQHSHNLTCKLCNKVVHLPHCPMEKIEGDIGKNTNYKILSHSLEFIGICPECQTKEKEKLL